jgi:hypothetical protein
MTQARHDHPESHDRASYRPDRLKAAVRISRVCSGFYLTGFDHAVFSDPIATSPQPSGGIRLPER